MTKLRTISQCVEEEQPIEKTFKIKYQSGDLFRDSPKGTMYIHSCNCEGVWGAGVAKDFKRHFPGAFDVYESYSKGNTSLPEPALGSALILLPPGFSDYEAEDDATRDLVYIACLFVKTRRGAPKDRVEIEQIKSNTKAALGQLVKGIDALAEREPQFDLAEIRMPKINSGIFKVPWVETAQIIEETLRPIAAKFEDLGDIVVCTG